MHFRLVIHGNLEGMVAIVGGMFLGNPALQLRRQTYVGVFHIQPAGHLFPQKLAEGTSIDPGYQFPDDPAEVSRVIRQYLARRIVGLDLLHRLNHFVPVLPFVPG